MKEEILKNKLPAHIAVIMDGNGRWAKKRNGIRLTGHKAGAKSVRVITESCAELGIKYLTLYAFSTENWSRPGKEISGLMNLLVDHLDRDFNTLMDNKIKLTTIGDKTKLPKKVQDKINSVIDKTKNCDRMTLNLALSYSGRWDINHAARNMALDILNGKKGVNDLAENEIENYLSTNNMPDPELIIRTSGEKRISNYMLYQMAYSELYFTDTLWPDFDENELYKAIIDFQSRERRFGKTSEQL